MSPDAEEIQTIINLNTVCLPDITQSHHNLINLHLSLTSCHSYAKWTLEATPSLPSPIRWGRGVGGKRSTETSTPAETTEIALLSLGCYSTAHGLDINMT